MEKRKFTVTFDKIRNVSILIASPPPIEVGFCVWREVGRHASFSQAGGGKEEFHFGTPVQLNRAKEVLIGAKYEEE